MLGQMTNVIRLFLLLALSFQTAAFSWANSSPASERTGTGYMAHEADSMEMPCDLTENETCDSASDEGLQESLHFNLVVNGNRIILPRLEQWYNFFLRYGIPPPELL